MTKIIDNKTGKLRKLTGEEYSSLPPELRVRYLKRLAKEYAAEKSGKVIEDTSPTIH